MKQSAQQTNVYRGLLISAKFSFEKANRRQFGGVFRDQTSREYRSALAHIKYAYTTLSTQSRHNLDTISPPSYHVLHHNNATIQPPFVTGYGGEKQAQNPR
jgi:hypothetical protein